MRSPALSAVHSRKPQAENGRARRQVNAGPETCSTRGTEDFRAKVAGRGANAGPRARFSSSSSAVPVRCCWRWPVAATGFACTQKGPLSDEEMEQLRAFMLPAGPPRRSRRTRSRTIRPRRAGKEAVLRDAVRGRASRALQRRRRDGNAPTALWARRRRRAWCACASCHDPATGGADSRSRPNETSLGASYTHRNAPTVINAAYSPRVAVLGRARRFAVEPGAAAARGRRRVRRHPARGRRTSSTTTTATDIRDCSARTRCPTTVAATCRPTGSRA